MRRRGFPTSLEAACHICSFAPWNPQEEAWERFSRALSALYNQCKEEKPRLGFRVV